MKISTLHLPFTASFSLKSLYKKLPGAFAARLLMMVVLCAGAGKAWGQLAVWNPSWSGTSASPFAATTLGSNVASGSLARVNLTGASSSTRYSSSNWSASNFLTVTITPSPGFVLNLNGQVIGLTMGSSGTGPNLYTLRSDVDGFASALGTATPSCSGHTLTNITLPSSGYNGLSSITFRIVGSTTGCSSTFSTGGTGGPSVITVNGSAVSAGNTAPSLSTPTSTSITNSTTILGATITSNGGVTITESGIVYGTSAAPTGNATLTSPLVTSGVFTVNVSSLNPQTQYFYRGYAVNSVGTGYSADGNFRTLSNPPTVQATGLSGTLTSSTAVNLTWSAATFPGSGATTKGYVLLRAASPNSPSLGNSNGAAPTAGANTTIVSSTIAEGATSQASASLTANTTYNYLLIPFCWDGTNAATYNYLTLSAPTFSIATPSNLSDVVAVTSSESATISSLVNDAGPLTSTTGVQVWQISVRDGGSANNDIDVLPTIVSGITLSQNAGNAMDNWLDAIKTVALFDGATWIANGTVSATTISFSGLSVNVADNSSKTLSIRLSLNETLNNVGSGNLDNDDFVFSLTNANFTTLTDGTSSTKSSFSTVTSTNGQNAVSVVATKLGFVVQPTTVTTNTSISPAVTVQATDIGGNRDRDFVSAIEITATGSTLTGSPVTATAAFGLSTFSSLQLSVAATGVTLDANFSGLTGITSNAFNVTLPLSSYQFRSRLNGDWTTVTPGSETWEKSTDGINWVASDVYPNSSAGVITVLNGYTITISSIDVSADQFTIDNGGQITIGTGRTLTIADGAGTDLTVSGIISNAGSLNNSGQAAFLSGGKYVHTLNGGTIPVGTIWDANSTLEVTGATTSQPTFSSSATYGHVTWNCSVGTSALNLSGNLRNIAGDFKIISTGTTGEVRLLASTSGITISIAGDLIIQGGKLVFSNGNASTSKLSLGGSYNQSGGTFDGDASGTMTFEFTGLNKSFTKTSGVLTNTLINWSINSGASLTLSNDLPVATSRTLTVNGALVCGINKVTGSGAVSVSSTGTLKVGSLSSSGAINDNITATLNALPTGSTVEYNGAAAQFATSRTFSNLVINNAAGVSLNASSSIIVNGTLTLSSGTLDVGSNTLTLNSTVTATSGTISTATNGTIVYGQASGTQAILVLATDYGNLTLSSNATKAFGANAGIAGNFAVSGGAVTLPSIMRFTGASAQNIAGLAYTNIAMSGSGTKTFTSDGSLSDVMSFESGTGAIDFDGSGNDKVFTIRSNATNTARIDNTFGTTISGKVTMERWIPQRGGSPTGGRAYRLLAPTVNTTGSVKANWMEGVNNTAIGTNNDPNAGYGTQVSGSGGTANGFDVTASNAPSLYFSSNGAIASLTYTAATSTTTGTGIATMNALTGYFLYIRGDRSVSMQVPLGTNMPTTSTTLRTTGTLVTGPVSTFTNAYTGGGTHNLVTNPYPSPISWASVKAASSNITPYYTLWDPNVGSRGGFVTVHTDGTVGGGGTATVNIQTGQAFFVEHDNVGPNPVVNIQEGHKTAGNNNTVFIVPPESFQTSLYFIEDSGYRRIADGVNVRYDDVYSTSVDINDAKELENWDENIAINRESKRLAIESRPVIMTRDTIPLFMNNMKVRAYEFEFVPASFTHIGLKAELIDRFLNTRTLLSVVDTSRVNFTVTADPASKATDRFMVIFGPMSPLAIDVLTIKAQAKNNGVQVDWTAKTEKDMDRYELERSFNGTVFTKINTTAAIGNSPVAVNYSWLDANPQPGNAQHPADNFYRIKAIDKAGLVKYTDIVKVNVGKLQPAITVSPNPVSGSSFVLRLSDMEKGNYTIAIINSLGQRVYSAPVQYGGGSSNITVTAGALAKGIYEVVLTGDGTRITNRLIKN